MGFVINLHQLADGGVRVLLRGGERAVAEQLLDGAEIGAVGEQVPGEKSILGGNSGTVQLFRGGSPMKLWKCGGLALALVWLAACGSKLPVQTSLGELHRVEKVQSISKADSTGGTIAADTGETLLVLHFRGKKEIRFDATPEPPYFLTDSSDRRFRPIYQGTEAADGTLSTKGWEYNGVLKAVNGQNVFEGVLSTPEPHFALVYRVPQNAKGLKLQDRTQAFAID